MQLGARQLKAAADEILRVIARPVNEAGIEPHRQELEARISKAASDFHHVDTQIGAGVKREDGPVSGMTSMYTQLHPALGAIETAFKQFNEAVAGAQKFVTQHGGTLNIKDPVTAVATDLGDMERKLDLKHDEVRPRAVDERPEAVVREEALGANLTALHEAIGAVRAGMNGGADQVVQGDVRKVVRHANAINGLLQQITDPKVLKSHRKPVHQAVQEVLHLDKEVEARPALAAFMRSTQLAAYLSAIQAKIGH
ncbi:MAG TPA: hypothetical protein VFK02_21535 [Kofleriaceae bacterium]|nr:hypothetical protein [Kofleriaceae bacterium]